MKGLVREETCRNVVSVPVGLVEDSMPFKKREDDVVMMRFDRDRRDYSSA